MAGRFERMIIVTCLLTLAFIFACVSTGTNSWMTVEQTGKDANIISLTINQGLFEKCIEQKMRSRMKSTNCYSLYGYGGYNMKDWEKAAASLMVIATILMGLVVIFNGYLMIQPDSKTGIMSDLSPIIIGNVAAVIAIIALVVYNSKYEVVRNSITQQPSGGSSHQNFADTDVDFGYSFYVGWITCFTHFFVIFFHFIFKAWHKHREETKRGNKMAYTRAV